MVQPPTLFRRGGGGKKPVPLGNGPGVLDENVAELLALNEALDKLKKADARKAEVVMLCYLADLTIDEVAKIILRR